MAISKHVLNTYSPESIVVVLSNDKFQHTVQGFVEGTFLELTRVVPHATLYTGADATNSRVVRAVRNFEITLTLAQTSERNDLLSQILAMDEETRGGEDIFSITIKDTSGRTVASAGQAFIGTTPDVTFSEGIEGRAWVLNAVNMSITEGGNGKFTESTAQTLGNLGVEVDEYWR